MYYYLLSIPLAEVTDVVWEHGEVVGDAVLMAEADDDRQADAGRGVPLPGRLRRRWPRHHRGTVHNLRHVLFKNKMIYNTILYNHISGRLGKPATSGHLRLIVDELLYCAYFFGDI